MERHNNYHIYKISKVANTSGGPKYDPDLLNNDGWNSGDTIYITGLKLSYGKAGR